MTDESPLSRTESLLALLVLHNMSDKKDKEKAVLFSRAGFSNAQIATLLGTTTASVTQALYEVRKATKKGAKKTAKKTGKAPAKKGAK